MGKLIAKIRRTLVATGETYKNVFRYYYPAHDGNGFTERNQTFNFSHNYIKNSYDAVIWQELPVKCKVKEGHIDTLIIDNELKIILFVEAKRISRSQISRKFSSIKDDINRLCADDFISSLPKGILINEYQHYILYLADVWYDDSEGKLDPRKGVLTDWKDKLKFENWIPKGSDVTEIGYGICQIGKPSSYKQIDKIYEKNNQEEYNLMYRLYLLPKQNQESK